MLSALRIFFLSFLFFIFLVLVINVIQVSLAPYRVWLEEYINYILIFLLVILITYWSKLMPTLRTVFRLSRERSDTSVLEPFASIKYLLIILTTGWLLLIFGALQEVDMFAGVNNHPARYGYIGDALILLSLLISIAKLTTPSRSRINEGAFASDDPGSYPAPTASQQQSIKYLKDILANGMPRSIALTGDWGSGKTAVYQHAKKAVSETHDDIIWVDFDPWRYASEEALVKGFYESIAKRLDEEIPGLQNVLHDMIKSVDQLVSKSDSTGIFKAFSNFAGGYMSGDANPDRIIKGLIDREGKRLIIVLDDVERQYDKERTYRALQLVHHAKTMGKDNVQVLCVFEKSTLLNAAPDHMSSREEYLEKFSEIEINVAPPEEFALRAHLEELLDDPKYAMYFPGDFDMKLSAASIRDIKSHRGIIRAFNELLLELKSTSDRVLKLGDHIESGTDAVMYVNYGDRFLMGHLKLKYPLIYRDIAENRSLYTQTKEREEDLRSIFMDQDEVKKERVEKFQRLFEDARLNADQRVSVKELLVDLFPVLSEVFDLSKRHVDTSTLRAQRRIGHRDVLDAYFALTASQDAYQRHEKWINELLKGLKGGSDDELIAMFEQYMSRSREDDSETDSITLLRNELLKTKHKAYQLRAFIAWMRVVLMDDTSNHDDDNRALGRILSAINDIIQRSPIAEKDSLSRSVFENVTLYLKKPYTALLMLLFLLPERQNDYLHDYIADKAFKQGGLYQRVLKWVDNYFFNSEVNVYSDYKYEEWAFITYQWALSIRAQGTTPNELVRGAKTRQDKVSKYLYRTLLKDDRIAHKFIVDRFKRNEDGDGWRVDAETITPHSSFTLLKLANNLIKSRLLTISDREQMIEFKESLEAFRSDLYS